MEADMDWGHCPHHQFASHNITPTGHEPCRDSKVMLLSYAATQRKTSSVCQSLALGIKGEDIELALAGSQGWRSISMST